MSVKLTDRASVPAVIKEMTKEEKIKMVSGGCTFSSAPNERLGIPVALMTDAGVGVNLRHHITEAIRRQLITCVPADWGALSKYAFIMDNVDTPENLSDEERMILDEFLAYLKKFVPDGELPSCFPVNSCLASTWDEDLLLEVARAVGREACVYGVDMLLGTTGINIQRDPRGGRGFEYYSEDPYLITRLAPMYPIGVQEQGVIADVKHYAANSQETNRHTIDEHISERALREIYLPGFKACVQKGGVKTVMSSYNKINGQYVTESKWLLTDILRGEWGFDGFVVSDWSAIKDHPTSLKAGNDLRMPPPKTDTLTEALENGTITEADLDLAIERILNVIVEMPVMRGRKWTTLDGAAAKETAYKAAAAGMVLLHNKENALPLSEKTAVAFYGDGCRQFIEAGIGSGRVHTNKHSSMAGRAESIVGASNVTYNSVSCHTGAVVVTVSALGQEGADRDDISLPAEELALVKKAIHDAKEVNAKVILVLNVAGPVEVEEVLDDLDAVVLTYFPGMEGGNACADLLFGRVCPSGKLAQTFAKKLCDLPAYGNFPGEYDNVNYGEGIFVGYRWYDTKEVEPRWCFGHGLSYTTFQLSDAKISKPQFNHNTDCCVSVTVKVKNTGKVAGAEVVQLYLSDVKSTMPKPKKELKGFQKVFLQPGEEKMVTMELTKESFSSFDEKKGWVVEPGLFQVLLGVSSRDIRCTLDLPVVGKNPYGYGAETKFKTLLFDDRAMNVLKETCPEGIWTDYDISQEKSYPTSTLFFKKFSQTIAPRLTGWSDEQKQALLDEICDKLSDIDVTDMVEKYKETEIY